MASSNNLTAGAAGVNYTFGFNITQDWNSNFRFAVTFPAGFNVSLAGPGVLTGCSGTAGTLVLDSVNSNLLGRKVAFSRTSAGNCRTGTTTNDLTIGVTGVKNPTLVGVTGTFFLETRDNNGNPEDNGTAPAVTIVAGAASQLVAANGPSLTGVSASASQVLQARVRDVHGNSVAGTTVNWAVTGGGSLSAASNVSGSDGLATVTLTTGTNAGTNTVTATSGTLSGSPVTFTIETTNTLPGATSGTLTVTEDIAQLGTLAAADANGNALTYSISTAPSNGSISNLNGNTGNYTYIPNQNETGSDSFAFVANDTFGNSTPAVVSVTINPLNDAPSLNAIVTPPPILEDATLQTVSFTGIGPGGGSDEANQTLTVTATSNNLDLIPHPTVVYTPSQTNGSLTFTPVPNANGTATITVSVSDNGASGGPNVNATSRTFQVTVNAVNDEPLLDAIGNPAAIDEDAAEQVLNLTGIGTGGGSGESGQVLTVNATSSNTAILPHPTVTYTSPQSAATVRYTPVANAAGHAVVTITVSDNGPGGAPEDNTTARTFTVVINALNDAPTLNAIATPSPILEDAAQQTVSLTGIGPGGGSDEASQILTVTATSSNTAVIPHPTVVYTPSQTNGSLTFTPVANASGTATITVSVSDNGTAGGANFNSTSRTFQVTVTAVNDAPVLSTITTPVPILEDVGEQILNLTGIAEGPANEAASQTLAVTATSSNTSLLLHPTVTYSPDGATAILAYAPVANASGVATVTVRVTDSGANGGGNGDVNVTEQTFTVTVNSVNDPPVAVAQAVSTREDTALGVTLAGTDVDGDTLAFAIVGPPANGSLTGTGANRMYTPAANFSGLDAFRFRVNDGTVNGTDAIVNITILPVNDAPVANPQNVSATEDIGLAINLSGSDIESDPLTFTIVTGPTLGALSGIAPNLTYTPNPNATGSDNFTYLANDGALNSSTVTVAIAIAPVNDPPVAANQTVPAIEDTPVVVTLTASDVDGNALTYNVTSPPTNGILTGAALNLTYSPAANFSGTDVFSYRAHDGTANSAIATVTVVVAPVNDLPIANASFLFVTEDQIASGILTGFDIEGNSLAFAIVAPPTNGTITSLDPLTGHYAYTPFANRTGGDSFTFNVNDTFELSPAALVTLAIAPVNDLPIANASGLTVLEDTSTNGVMTAYDVDGDALVFSIASPPTHGTVSILNLTTGAFSYMPNPNQTGTDSFTFRAGDAVGNSTASFAINTTPVNDAPVASGLALATPEDTAAPGTLAATDIDSVTLNYTLVTTGTKGTAILADWVLGTFVYTPNPNATGTDNFTYRANDGALNSSSATVSIAIAPINDLPIAVVDTYFANPGVTISPPIATGILANDLDGDSNGLVALLVGPGPSNGTLTLFANGTFVYAPNSTFVGTDGFDYVANDGTGNSTPATVSIVINPVPIASARAEEVVLPGAAVTLNGTGSTDPDADYITYLWTQVGGPGVSIAGNTTSTPTFTAPPGPVVLVFQLLVTDSEGATSLDRVSLSVPLTVTLVGGNGTTLTVPPLPPESAIDNFTLGLGTGGAVNVTLTVYDQPPAGYPTPPTGTGPGVYLNISVVPDGNATVTQGVIQFSLPQSWFVANACPVATCIVNLQHHTGGEWAAVTTSRLSNLTADPVLYEATTTSFSPFVPSGAVPAPGGSGGGGGGGGGGGSASTPRIPPAVAPAPTVPGVQTPPGQAGIGAPTVVGTDDSKQGGHKFSDVNPAFKTAGLTAVGLLAFAGVAFAARRPIRKGLQTTGGAAQRASRAARQVVRGAALQVTTGADRSGQAVRAAARTAAERLEQGAVRTRTLGRAQLHRVQTNANELFSSARRTAAGARRIVGRTAVRLRTGVSKATVPLRTPGRWLRDLGAFAHALNNEVKEPAVASDVRRDAPGNAVAREPTHSREDSAVQTPSSPPNPTLPDRAVIWPPEPPASPVEREAEVKSSGASSDGPGEGHGLELTWGDLNATVNIKSHRRDPPVRVSKRTNGDSSDDNEPAP